MRLRTLRRIAARTAANAALCGMALTEWQQLTSAERRRRKRAAKGRLRDELHLIAATSGEEDDP
jgi:hypothetical protein